jgi:hypothetical protein
MSRIALLSMLLVLLSSVAYAHEAAYVVRNPLYPDSNIVDALTAADFTVSLIDDGMVGSTDFSQYDLIVVGDEPLANAQNIPINQYPSLVANSYHADEWGFGDWIGTTAVGNNYINGRVLISNSITEGLGETVRLYTGYNVPVYYLPRLPQRSYDLDNVVSTNNYQQYPLIGLLEAGDRLYGGGYAGARSCFFGMTETNYWTPQTEQMFVGCALYSIYGLDTDGDGYYRDTDCDDHNPLVNPDMVEVIYNGWDDDCDPGTLDDDMDQDGYDLADDCDDNDPSLNPGMTDIPYDGIDQDCDGSDLRDVDGDGVDIGPDCNDNDASVYPGAPEIPYDGIDQDCDGSDLLDADGDGYDYTSDCDDDDAQVNPSAPETAYNGIDDDCNPATLDDDLDQDGFDLADDCDDSNAAVNPDGTELVYNGKDDDCDPSTPDDDLDQDGFDLADDCDDMNSSVNPLSVETPYNGKDDDCDPSTLDDDLDQDGYVLSEDCDDSDADVNPGMPETYFNGIDDDCDPATVDDDTTPPNPPQSLHALYSGGAVELGWEAPVGEPVALYNIYTASSPDSFYFITPSGVTAELSWTDSTAASDSERYYVVRAQDPAGNEENNTYTVGKFDVELDAGYNLASLPLIPYSTVIGDVIAGQAVTGVLRYHSGRLENAVENGGWQSDFGFTELYAGEGYFFVADSSFTMTFTGAVPDAEQSTSIQAGLNLVGFTSIDTGMITDMVNNSQIVEIMGYAGVSYQIATYYPSAGQWYSTEGFYMLEPGRGYWLRAQGDSTWQYTTR